MFWDIAETNSARLPFWYPKFLPNVLLILHNQFFR